MATEALKKMTTWDCPICGESPAEPVVLEGQRWCTGHVEWCTCGNPMVPGEIACRICLELIKLPAGAHEIAIAS